MGIKRPRDPLVFTVWCIVAALGLIGVIMAITSLAAQ